MGNPELALKILKFGMFLNIKEKCLVTTKTIFKLYSNEGLNYQILFFLSFFGYLATAWLIVLLYERWQSRACRYVWDERQLSHASVDYCPQYYCWGYSLCCSCFLCHNHLRALIRSGKGNTHACHSSSFTYFYAYSLLLWPLVPFSILITSSCSPSNFRSLCSYIFDRIQVLLQF